MLNTQISKAAFADTKPHYEVLNGLRGVAAIVVVIFHIFEAFATSHLDQKVNHGYLAVDFFFILSGFVVAYAYDDRWGRMSIKDFLKRRFIRLHPMVVMGALIGAVMFYFQVSNVWDVTKVSVTDLLIATLLSALLIPATVGGEIRGLGEMFPLNGPSWSLFFEYIGNILYAFFIRRLHTWVLTIVVLVSAVSLARFSIWGPTGDICVGYSLTGSEFTGGISRLLFSFTAGLLLFRIFKPLSNVKGFFWIGAIVLTVLLSLPRIGGAEDMWKNGLYDAACSIIAFPLLVYLGASEQKMSKAMTGLCKFLGDISYPLYMVHYPFIYLYYAWVKNSNLSFEQSLPGAAGVVIGSFLLAYLSLRFYDIPVRRYLTKLLFRK
ncbi:MAG: acyltransferase [Chitinophagaceae bacterium]|nr:acyltransferase [Chitinophagaceae bacterium]